MNFKVANLTYSAIDSGAAIRRNSSFRISFLHYFPFLDLASQLAIYSYKRYAMSQDLRWYENYVQ